MPILAFNLGPMEILLILVVALLVFGKRLPEVARSLGQGLTEFRRGLRDEPTSSGPKPLPPREETTPTSDEAGEGAGEEPAADEREEEIAKRLDGDDGGDDGTEPGSDRKGHEGEGLAG